MDTKFQIMKKIQKLNQDTLLRMKITVTRKMMKILKTERIRRNLMKVENPGFDFSGAQMNGPVPKARGIFGSWFDPSYI